MKTLFRSFPAFFHLLLLVVLLATGCKILENTGQKLGRGFGKGVVESKIDSLIKESADSVLNALVKSERYEKLRFQTGLTLQQLQDSLNDTMEGLTDRLTAGLVRTVQAAKDTLTDRQLKDYVQQMVDENLTPALKRTLDGLSAHLSSRKFSQNLGLFRYSLSLELDTLSDRLTQRLADSLTVQLGEGVENSIIPPFEKMLKAIADERENLENAAKGIKNDASSLVWRIAGAVVLVLLLGFALRTHILKRKYRRMMEVVTAEINKIPQPAYDPLVQRISEKMKNDGLEKLLRSAILEKQHLTDQPEWEHKDTQLINLLIQKRQSNGLNDPAFQQQLKEKNLVAHYRSKLVHPALLPAEN